MPTRKPKRERQYSKEQWLKWHKKELNKRHREIRKAKGAIKAAKRSLDLAIRILDAILARPPGDGPSGKG